MALSTALMVAFATAVLARAIHYPERITKQVSDAGQDSTAALIVASSVASDLQSYIATISSPAVVIAPTVLPDFKDWSLHFKYGPVRDAGTNGDLRVTPTMPAQEYHLELIRNGGEATTKYIRPFHGPRQIAPTSTPHIPHRTAVAAPGDLVKDACAYSRIVDEQKYHKSGKEYDMDNKHHILPHMRRQFANATTTSSNSIAPLLPPHGGSGITDADGLLYTSARVHVQLKLAYEYFKQVIAEREQSGSAPVPEALYQSLSAAENMERHFQAVQQVMERAGDTDEMVLKETKLQMWFAFLHFVELARLHFGH